MVPLAGALVAILLVLPAAAGEVAAPLTGAWEKEGKLYARLEADGTGVWDGQPVRWKTKRGWLALAYGDGRGERGPYTVTRTRLDVRLPSGSQVLLRGSGRPRLKAIARPESPPASGGGVSLHPSSGAVAKAAAGRAPAPAPALPDAAEALLGCDWCGAQGRLRLGRDRKWTLGPQEEGEGEGDSQVRRGRWEMGSPTDLRMYEEGQAGGSAGSRFDPATPVLLAFGEEFHPCP